MKAIRPKSQSVPGGETAYPGRTTGPSRSAVDIVLAQLYDDKAEDVVTIDLAGKAVFADMMIVASGRSARQVAAMADHLAERLKQADIGPVRVEGKATADWVLIDAVDVVVHLFRPEVRAFYQIEKMWGAEAPGQSEGSALRPSGVRTAAGSTEVGGRGASRGLSA